MTGTGGGRKVEHAVFLLSPLHLCLQQRALTWIILSLFMFLWEKQLILMINFVWMILTRTYFLKSTLLLVKFHPSLNVSVSHNYNYS